MGRTLIAPQSLRLVVRPRETSDFELWRWSISPVFDVDTPSAAERADFALESQAYRFDGLTISHSQVTPMAMTRAQSVIARANIDDYMCILYRSGGSRFNADGVEGEARAGDVALFDMSCPVRIDAPVQNMFSIFFGRAEIARLIDPTFALHGLVLTNGEPLAEIFKATAQATFAEAPRLPGEQADAARDGLSAMLISCFAPTAKRREPTVRGLSYVAFQRVRAEIDRSLGDPRLDAEILCVRCGISRATLYRIFEPHGGVGAFIRRMRLARARKILMRRGTSAPLIAQVARDCGFNDATNFGRRFREAFQITPRELREAALEGECLCRENGSMRIALSET